MTKRILSFFLVPFLYIFVLSAESTSDQQAQAEIVQKLQNWSRDFNAKNSEAVCGLFAPDLIASYPGTVDKNYEEMCKQLTTSLKDPNITYHYDIPAIEQVIINGDLAIVRLVWTLKISYKNKPEQEEVRERGLDVFKRQKDGSWKIAISYAYQEIGPNPKH